VLFPSSHHPPYPSSLKLAGVLLAVPLSSPRVRSLLCGSLANALRFCGAQFLDLLHGLVEIADGLGGLDLAAVVLVLGKLGVGVLLGESVRDFARTGQNVAFTQPQEIIQLGDPIPHMHGAMTAGLQFTLLSNL